MPEKNDSEDRLRPLKCDRLLSTPLFAVEHREYVGGITRDVVVHPGAVVVLPILDDGRFVLIRNTRYAAGRELLELPAGTREVDEEPIETARRELEEETGYQARELEPFIRFFTSPGVLTERMHSFVASGLTYVGQRLEEGEHIDVVPISRQEVQDLLATGQLSDGKTLAVLSSYLLRATAGNRR